MKSIIVWLTTLLFAGWAFAAVNINTASVQELEALNGVGPVKAQAIVDYRKAHGPFKSIDQIKDVKGIGDATFDKIKADIAVGGSTTMPSAAAKTAPATAAPPAKPAPGPAQPSGTASTTPAKSEAPKSVAAAPRAPLKGVDVKPSAAEKSAAGKDKEAKADTAKEKTAKADTAKEKDAKADAAKGKDVKSAAADKAAADKAAADKAKK